MDFIRDRSGRCLFQVHNLGIAPDYVKQSAVSEECVVDLSPGQFADPASRLFPLDTAGHVYLSHAYAKYAGVSDARILRRIKKAAELLNIGPDLETLDGALAGLNKQAAEKSVQQFALLVDFGAGNPQSGNPLVKQGGTHGFYPINTLDEIVASSRDLAVQSDLLPMHQFVKACRTLVKAADVQQVARKTLPAKVLGFGQHRSPDLAFVREQAEKRAAATQDSLYKDLVVSFQQEGQPDDWDKWASLWEEADQLNKFAAQQLDFNAWQIFNSGVPVEAVEKEASNWLMTAQQVLVPVAAVAAIDESRLRSQTDKATAGQLLAIKTAAASGDTAGLQDKVRQLTSAAQACLIRLAAQSPSLAAA